MANRLDIQISWGGYYISVGESGEYSVFRLLDFNRQAYHATLYRERFSVPPVLDEVRRLVPFILHVPIDARGFLRENGVQLIGSKPLCRGDLEGYLVYLEHHEVPEEERNELAERLIEFSRQSPLRLELELVAGELTIREPQ